jgi:hypothetical protein
MLRLVIALVFTLCLAAAPPLLGSEEPQGQGDILADSPHPLDRKDAARAKFEALQTSPKELAQAKLAASQYSFESRFREFLAGRGTLDFMLEAFQQYSEAGIAVAQGPAEQAVYHEALWVLAYSAEHINRFRYEKGRIPLQDYAQSIAFRLQAQLALHRTWIPLAQKETRAGWYHGLDEFEDDSRYLVLPAKELAKIKFQATQTDEKVLIQGMLTATWEQEAARSKEFHAGRGTLDFLLESSVRLAHARLLASNAPDDRLASYENLWLACREIERVNLFRYQNGRIPSQDYAVSRYYRREAELMLLEAQAKYGKAAARQLKQDSDLPWLFNQVEPDYLKFLARDKRSLFQASQRELQRAKVQAAQEECNDRGKEFLAGRGTLNFIRDSCSRLLEAELAVSDIEAARLAALERHWLRTYQIEQVNQGRHLAGRIPTKDYTGSLHQRLDAELWLKQFLAEKKLPTVTPLRFRLEGRVCP